LSLSTAPFLLLYQPWLNHRHNYLNLLLAATKRLPVILCATPDQQITEQASVFAWLVNLNRQVLAALTLHQLVAKGAPFIYGIADAGLPNQGLLPGQIQQVLAICSGLAADYYGLPVAVPAGAISPIFDQQSGMEAGFSLLRASLSGANIIHGLGAVEAGKTISWAMLALANEAAGTIRHYQNGIRFSEEDLALNVIAEVGPGGNYFSHEHTVQHFRQLLYFPKLLNRRNYLNWEMEGSKDFYARAQEYIQCLLVK